MAANPDTHELLGQFEEGLRKHFPSKEDVLREAKAQSQRQRRTKGAILALVLVGALSGLWLVDPSLHTNQVTAGIGERKTVTLFDGSVVTVNTDSIVEIETHLRSRQIKLIQGEALFNVAHAWRPFTVHANRTTVLDIGTVFSVRNLTDGARVTVLEGAVEVSSRIGKQVLTEGQSLASLPDHLQLLDKLDGTAATAWQRGKFVFNGTPLEEVIADMQRYRQGAIQITDHRVARLRLSGEYDIQGIEVLLDALPEILPVEVRRETDGEVKIRSRPDPDQK